MCFEIKKKFFSAIEGLYQHALWKRCGSLTQIVCLLQKKFLFVFLTSVSNSQRNLIFSLQPEKLNFYSPPLPQINAIALIVFTHDTVFPCDYASASTSDVVSGNKLCCCFNLCCLLFGDQEAPRCQTSLHCCQNRMTKYQQS